MGFMHKYAGFRRRNMFDINLQRIIFSYGCVLHLIDAKLPCDLLICICFSFPFNFNLIFVITKYLGLTMHVFLTAFKEKSTRVTFS